MNDSIDMEVWEADYFYAIKNSKKVYEDNSLTQYECEIKGKLSKSQIEAKISQEEGKRIELIVKDG